MLLRARIPFFLHPWPLLAVFLLAFNDHYLKAHAPGVLSGKLSDFAGVFYFPLMLAAIWVLAMAAVGRIRGLTPALLLGGLAITDLIFVTVKLSPLVNDAVTSFFHTWIFPIRIVMDETDLVALVMNVPTWLFGRRYFRSDIKER